MGPILSNSSYCWGSDFHKQKFYFAFIFFQLFKEQGTQWKIYFPAWPKLKDGKFTGCIFYLFYQLLQRRKKKGF